MSKPLMNSWRDHIGSKGSLQKAMELLAHRSEPLKTKSAWAAVVMSTMLVENNRQIWSVSEPVAKHLMDTRPPTTLDHIPGVPGGAVYLSLPPLFMVTSGGEGHLLDGIYIVANRDEPHGDELLIVIWGKAGKGQGNDNVLWSRLVPGSTVEWDIEDPKVADQSADQVKALNWGSRIVMNFLLYLENGFSEGIETQPKLPRSSGKLKRWVRQGNSTWPRLQLKLAHQYQPIPEGERAVGKQRRHWRSGYWNYYWVKTPGGSRVLAERLSEKSGAELCKVARLVKGHYRGS